MMQTAAGIAYFIFIFLVVLSPLLPLALMWRSAAFSGVMLIAGHLLWGPIPRTDGDGGMMAALVGYLALVIGTLIVGRLCIAGARGKLTESVLTEREWLRPLDQAILIVTGGMAGLMIVYGLAHLLSQSGGGRLLDLAIALLAAAAVWVVVKRRVELRLPIASAGVVVSAIAFIGFWQAGAILGQAEAIAAGRPWCLTFPATGQPVRHIRELGFFSMPKGGDAEHLGLRIGTERMHWSIRQQSFQPGLRGEVSFQTTCPQRPNYADALRDGTLGQGS